MYIFLNNSIKEVGIKSMPTQPNDYVSVYFMIENDINMKIHLVIHKSDLYETREEAKKALFVRKLNGK